VAVGAVDIPCAALLPLPTGAIVNPQNASNSAAVDDVRIATSRSICDRKAMGAIDKKRGLAAWCVCARPSGEVKSWPSLTILKKKLENDVASLMAFSNAGAP
jgi:hypothetical protein